MLAGVINLNDSYICSCLGDRYWRSREDWIFFKKRLKKREQIGDDDSKGKGRKSRLISVWKYEKKVFLKS